MNETDLLNSARKFDPEALRIIFDSYSKLIYKYAFHLCEDAVEADNVVGDVFSQLLEQFALGKGPTTNLKAYLYQTAYHVIVNRARDRQHLSPLEIAESQEERTPSVSLRAETDMEIEKAIRLMNTELTPDQRHVLILRFVEGFNLQETAKIIGKSVNNIKVIQNRALAKMREAMNRR